MVTNKISENGTPEPLDSNQKENILNAKKIEKGNILKGKVKIRESSASLIDELKTKVDPQQDSLDMLFAHKPGNSNEFRSPKGGKEKSSVFTPILTRNESDIGKSLFHAVYDSVVVFGGVILDLGKDAFELAAHPIDTTQNALVGLKKQDPDLEIV